MKILFSIFWALASSIAFGQFAIIQDKDGNCNVRSSAETSDNIIDKLNNGHLVFAIDKSGNWTNIEFTKDTKENNGFVYKDRLIYISSYPAIPKSSSDNSKVVLKKETIQVILTQQNFDRSKHKLSFFKESPEYLEFIDNKKFWGTDGGIPNTEYKSIEVQIGAQKIILPKAATENLYEISLANTIVNHDKINDRIYIQSMNSDGAGTYEVIWKIEKGVYKERYIVYGF